MKKFIKIVFAILILCAFSLNSSASLITISITAQVTGVSDYDNLLEGKVEVNDIITGTYTYDTTTPDTNPSSDDGLYFHYTPPCGLNWTVGDLIFQTDPNNTKFLIEVINNSPYGDNYLVRSYNNLPLENGVQVGSISWQLDNYDGTALSSTALPITAPVLSDWDYSTLGIGGGVGTAPCYDKMFGIGATVTSAVLIPEPVSVLLFGFGLLMLRKQKKEV